MKRTLGRLGGFASNGIITGLATLLSISLIINLHGAATWSIFAVAQAAGLLLAVLVGFGWAVIGPATVAPMPVAQRSTEFAVAVGVRVSLFFLVALVATGIALSGVIPNGFDYLPVTLAYASTGFSSLWYYVGTGQAWASFFRDALPRAIASVAAPLLALAGSPLLVIGVGIFAGNVVALISTILFTRPLETRRHRIPTSIEFRRSIQRQWHGLLSGSASSAYMTLPTVVVGSMVPSVAGLFALGDKFVRLASTAALPMTQVLQGWVPRAARDERPIRVRRALLVSITAGATAGTALACLAPFVSVVFSSGQLELGPELSLPMGIVLACTLITQVVGTGCLGAYGDYRSIAISAIVGACVSLPVLFFATHTLGAAGAMWAIAAAEISVLSYQSLVLRRHLRDDGIHASAV